GGGGPRGIDRPPGSLLGGKFQEEDGGTGGLAIESVAVDAIVGDVEVLAGDGVVAGHHLFDAGTDDAGLAWLVDALVGSHPEQIAILVDPVAPLGADRER